LCAADDALSQKLAEELQYEKESNKEGSEPEFLKTFKAEGIWQVSTAFFSG
jgi:complement component 1 Q subcomponent-binding protein